MDFKQIQDLIKLVNKSNLSELKIEQGDFKLSLKTDKYIDPKVAAASMSATPQAIMPIQAPMVQQPMAAPVAQTPEATPEKAASPTKEAENESKYIEIRSPIVGTFYRAASPEKPPYKKVGDVVAVGDTVCIVEAMKLFNEIESEVSGTIVKCLIEDSTPVEYDQVLYLVDPN